ncbi:MAG: plasmid mobilization relaxosome protein MobC [Devosia sp.]
MSISEDFRSKSVSSTKPPRRPAPFSLRLSVEERTRLEKAAGGQPLGSFIREQLLGGDLVPRRTRGRTPVKDHAALAKVLAALGASRLANNLNQLAKAAHMGALPVSPEVEAELQEACAAVREIRLRLLQALGVGQGGAP